MEQPSKEVRPHDMPTLYTSYWANKAHWANKALVNLAVVPIGVSRGAPRYRATYRYCLLRGLAPSRKVFCIKNPDEFTAAYLTQLDALCVDRVSADLASVTSSTAAVPWPSCA